MIRPSFPQPEGISPSHIDALRSVDLTLSTGEHGGPFTLEDHGTVTLGVTQGSYTRIGALVDELRDGRGALAVGNYGFVKPWNPDVTKQEMHDLAETSPYLTAPDPKSPTYNADLATVLERATELQIVNPITYGEIKATLDGVPVVYADATRDELEKAPDSQEMWDTRFRDERMIFRLGKAAVKLVENNPTVRPKLTFLDGEAHVAGMRQDLRVDNVPHTVRRFSRRQPVRAHIYRAAMNVLPAVLASAVDNRVSTAPVRAWKRNLSKRLGNNIR